MKTKMKLCIGALACLAMTLPAWAGDFVIIVNKDNGNDVNQELAAKAYRGEAKTWAGGGSINAIALPEDNAVRVAFDKEVLGKAPSQTKAMWAALTFSGKAAPPKVVDSESDVVKAVADNKNAIGYVSAKAAGAGVKIVK
jgi:ABC-type phosphate transport system substrate-binding protein